MKFSHKIIAASSALLLTTLVLLSVSQQHTVKEEVKQITSASINGLIHGMKNTVTSEMAAKKALAQTTTEALTLDPNNKTYIKNILENPKLKSSFIAIGYGFQSDGFLIENDDGWDPDASYDPRKRPWFIDAKKKNALVVTDPYVDASSGTIIISVATLVKQGGQLIAGMFYDVNLGGLADLVNQVDLLDAGKMFIVTADGTTIAHPDSNLYGKNLDSYLPNVSIQEGEQTVEVDGINYVVSFAKIPSENWYVGAALEEDKIYSSLDTLQRETTFYVIAAVVFSMIALTFLMRYLLKPLGALNNALESVATGNGDLTKRLDTDTDTEFAQLATHFNAFIENLQTQIQDSKKISDAIKKGTELTVQGSSQSAQDMSTQLQELEQLATAMNEMTVTATEVANNAQGAAAAAKEADDATVSGSTIVGDTTNAIDNLSQRIDQAVEEVHVLESATANIETILKVINDIADQTNLLALNAAIEAARAGESGRGFAVVADEVRTLAQRTQESTTEIRSMIEQLQAGASSVSNAMNQSKETATEAVDRAQEANVALQAIRESIQHISDMNIHIASAAEEQSLVSEEINTNTVRIKDLSVQVGHAAEAASSAMKTQSEHVENQDKLLDKFIV